MSQENVDRFLAATEAFNRIAAVGDSGVPDYLRFMDPEVRFEPLQAVLQGSYAGLEGVRAWFADIGEHYEDWHIHVAEIRDHEDRVLAFGTLRVTGRGSGIDMEAPLAIVATFRDGLIARVQTPRDRDLALDAAGLSE
jgi:ketosteroid isomerase-like protein